MKQRVARNLYQTLINESGKIYQYDKPNFISKNCKKLNEICTQNKFSYPKYTVLRIKTSLEPTYHAIQYIPICFINDIEQIEIANTIKKAKDFPAIKMIYSLLQEDKKCEMNIINSLEPLHVTIQESFINDPKP